MPRHALELECSAEDKASLLAITKSRIEETRVVERARRDVAEKLDAGVHAVWRVLRREGIYLQRRRSWCVSTDKEFAPKAAEVVGLYLNPPVNAVVLSVDEKPSLQAIERASGYVETDSGKVVRGLKSTYKRHGTLNLFAALEVGTGQVKTKFTEYKKREDFRSFLDDVSVSFRFSLHGISWS